MYMLLALLLLALTAAAHAALALLARYGVSRAFGSGGADRRRAPAFGAGRGLAGVAGWYLASGLIVTVALLQRGDVVPDDTSMRVHVAAGGPAARAGIQDGDRIVTVAGEPITSWDQLKREVGKSSGNPLAVEIDRGGQALTLDVTPEGTPPKMMIVPPSEVRKLGIGSALASGLARPAKVNVNTFKGLWRMLAGAEHPELSGPVGIVKETSSASKNSVSLGLMLAATLGAYALPLVAFASVLFEILTRRR